MITANNTGPAGAPGPAGPVYKTDIILVGDLNTTTESGGFVVIGGAFINPSEFLNVDSNLKFRFEVIVSVDNLIGKCYFQLYNVTDGIPVVVSESSSETPENITAILEPDMTLGFPNSLKYYEVRFKVDAGRIGTISHCVISVFK